MNTDVSCKLCYETFSMKHPYRVPRQLVCTHVYCTECVEKLKQIQGASVECPSCFAITTIPSKGVDYLPTQFKVLGITEGSKTYAKCKHCIKNTYPPKSATLHCIDCDTFYCGACSDTTHLQVGNQNHIVRLANSNGDIQLSRESSARFSRESSARSMKHRRSVDTDDRSIRSSSSASPICMQHDEYLTMYCEKKQVRMCAKCKLTPQHCDHDCNLMEKNEDEERSLLMDLKFELDEEIDSYSKVRQHVQTITEDLKKNCVVTNSNIERYFRNMRAAVDDTEKNILLDVQTIFNKKLGNLKEQCSKMIDVVNTARRIGEETENIMDMEYYQMLVEKKKIEVDVISSLESMKNVSPCENAELFVQFPHHEDILASIRTSPYIVRPPPPPVNFICTLTRENKVLLTWDVSPNLKYTYMPTIYAVYASTGKDDAFVLLHKIKSREYSICVNDPKLMKKKFVQFQVSAINVVGEGKPCFPICIRLVETRYLED